MSTLAASPTAFGADRSKQVMTKPNDSIYGLVITYALLIPLVFLAARGAFSFQSIQGNTASVGDYGTGGVGAGEGNALHSAELITAFGMLVLAMYPVWKGVVDTCRRNAFLLLLPAWAILSTLWSADVKRSLLFGVLAMIVTITGMYISVRFTPKQQLQLFLLVGITSTLLSFALIVGLPSAGVDHKNTTVGFQGIYPHKGICAFLTLGFLPAAFFYKFQGVAAKLKRSIYILLLATLTIGTMARTAWFMLALILGFMALVKYLYKLKPVERVLVTAFLPAFIAVGSLVVYLNEAVILKALGKDPTFSGRTAIWAVAFLAIIKQPIIGFGYSAFWSVNNPEAFRLALAAGDPHLSNAENGVLQMWLELGLVGVLLVMFMLVRTTRNALACLKSDTPNYALWYMTILFITLLSLIDGDKFMLPTALEWVMFIMADIGLANEARRVRATRTAWA